ncbi:hypothetical protein AO398_19225 [Methylobacterium sp. GXS13]|uniref:hypothetical protein n=1 Tax=unclassified Methylobacterium TaxID=2615210 RepID=UPI00071B39F3|nr:MULTISPECIES: hypothetical protein [unclassified Methylobacterium]KST58996.1 hypothetical protein AO398_19225 [Methylobacterium sp. GXS13]MCJ2117909.1 hypothetical protein [Methylobacterium sp. J-001]
MRKLTFAFAVLASLGGAALVQPASAAPGLPSGVTAPDALTQVRMTPMERRMMHRRMERRMMHRHMHRKMMHRRMMRRM